MTTQPVDIVIPVFNNAAMTVACLKSIRDSLDNSVQVILVDNGSDALEQSQVLNMLYESELKFIYSRMGENTGFVNATNRGLELSTAPYIMLLNNDTELPKNWAAPLINVFQKEPSVGIVGTLSSNPKQWQGNNTQRIRKWCRHRGYFIMDWSDAMVSFFAAMLRREVIEKVGLLSVEYKMGLGDDDDYCERIRLAGFHIAICDQVTVKHHHRTTFRKVYGENGWLDMERENMAMFKSKYGRTP